MSANGQAALFAFLIALVFGAGFLAALWFDRSVDGATRLPARPHRPRARSAR